MIFQHVCKHSWDCQASTDECVSIMVKSVYQVHFILCCMYGQECVMSLVEHVHDVHCMV